MDADAVALWMNSLTDKEFIEFFYARLASRHIFHLDRSYIDSHLVLVNASRDRASSGAEQPWQLDLLCPTPEEEWINDAPVCQYGHHCDMTTASWAKNSKCPVCSGEVFGT